mgnify:CR=1 FL=1
MCRVATGVRGADATTRSDTVPAVSSLPPPPPGAGSGPSTPPPAPAPAQLPAPSTPGASYRQAPPPGSYYRIGRPARTITILLGLVVAFQIMSIPVALSLHHRAQDFLSGRISPSKFEDAITKAQSLLGFQGGAQAALAVLVIIWMYRVAANHRALGRPNSSWAPGWAIGGWFVPPGFVLAVPWLMLKEFWRGSDPTIGRDDPTWKQRAVSPWIHVWWITFGFGVPITGAIAGGAVGVHVSIGDLAKRTIADDAKAYTDLLVWQYVSTALTIIAAIAFIKIVIDITSRQRSLTGGE